MDIPIEAEVVCTNGVCGHATYIILNPVKNEVTHFVVEEDNLPNIERLVPIEQISESTHDEVHLRCSREELSRMEPFVETDFIRSDEVEYSVPFEYPYAVPFLIWPYTELPNGTSIVKLEHLPPSEMAVRRGAEVEATDGYVGEIDEFIINPKNDHITHLVLRKGPFWGEKDVAIPISKIDHMNENKVFLKLDKSGVAALPGVPVKRHWR